MSKEEIDNLSGDEKIRYNTIRELIGSERRYFENLEKINTLYIEPMEKLGLLHIIPENGQLITEQQLLQIKSLNQCIKDIIAASKTFIENLDNSMFDLLEVIADPDTMDMMKLHSEYCNIYTGVKRSLNLLQEKDEKTERIF
eukprot:UN26450